MPATYTAQPAAMASHSLPQLVSEVPGVLRQVSKRKQSSTHLDLDSWFDFDSFYAGGVVTRDSESRSRAGSSSAPGLTSAGSEEDGSPSPSPTEDSFRFRDYVKDAKKQDDQFTVPQRELRPKSNLTYPELMQIDVEPGHNSTAFSDSQAMMGINNTSSLAHHSHHASRGRRSGPLKNSTEVAHVRQVGACIPCRIRKVACDADQRVCSQCSKAAAKESLHDPVGLAHEKCFRSLCPSDNAPFRAMSHFDVGHRPLQNRMELQGHISNWFVTFDPSVAHCLKVPVTASSRFTSEFAQPLMDYNLCMDRAPRDGDLIQWAGFQMSHPLCRSFEGVLDNLLYECSRHHAKTLFPQFGLVQKVFDMKCMYTILRQDRFWYTIPGSGVMEELPESVHRRLRGIAKRALRELEPDILKAFNTVLNKEKLKGEHDRLAIWACALELILMYRDLLNLTTEAPQLASMVFGLPTPDPASDFHQLSIMTGNLLRKLIVVCEVTYGKKPPKELPIDGSAGYTKQVINQLFLELEMLRGEFCREVSQSPRHWDRRLFALLSEGRKSGQQRARQTKRPKTSQR